MERKVGGRKTVSCPFIDGSLGHALVVKVFHALLGRALGNRNRCTKSSSRFYLHFPSLLLPWVESSLKQENIFVLSVSLSLPDKQIGRPFIPPGKRRRLLSSPR